MPQQFDVVVLRNEMLTPHMRRVVVTGEALRTFPENQESGYVKIAFEQAGERVLRSYTIRNFAPQRQELTLDFVDHGDNGPASHWVRHAQPGDPITFFGPGEKKLVDAAADWFILAGDLSALPALSANLEQMPPDAHGYAVIEIPDERDRQVLNGPEGVDVIWVVADDREPNKALVETVTALPWLDGRAYPWFAGEFEGMRAMRRYFRQERGVGKRDMYLSCYWKLGDTNEGMKLAKRRDTELEALAA